MRNLTAPKQYDDERGTSFDSGCEGIVLYTPAGDPVRIHVGADGFLYVNGSPFGVQGMPPAKHAATHMAGEDKVTPDGIGAVSKTAVSTTPMPDGVAGLGGDGKIPTALLADVVTPAAHADSHKQGAADALSAVDLGGVADDDQRLSNARKPIGHADGHAAIGGHDPLTPAMIGAVDLDDVRLTDNRFPLPHNTTHFKDGPDPISWADVGAPDVGQFTVRERIPNGYPKLNDLGHIDLNLLPRGLAPALHSETHAKDGTDFISPVSIDAADRQHQHANADIIDIDATKITTGTVDIARLPAAAVERLVPVNDLTAMYALTADIVQIGDVVQTLDTGLMYRVVDDTALNNPNGYRVFTAGMAAMAAQVPWAGVMDKPAEYRPEAHAQRHRLGGDDAVTAADVGAPTVAELAAVGVTAQAGVDNARAAQNTANSALAKVATAQSSANNAQTAANSALAKVATAQSSANNAQTAANAANANAATRALQSDFLALSARLAALESAAVTSSDISIISGGTLSDGVGTLHFLQK